LWGLPAMISSRSDQADCISAATRSASSSTGDREARRQTSRTALCVARPLRDRTPLHRKVRRPTSRRTVLRRFRSGPRRIVGHSPPFLGFSPQSYRTTLTPASKGRRPYPAFPYSRRTDVPNPSPGFGTNPSRARHPIGLSPAGTARRPVRGRPARSPGRRGRKNCPAPRRCPPP
jgi:hypothetical protein